MKISRNWLNDFVEINDLSEQKIASLLTALGHEVEVIEHPNDFTGVVVGKVETCEAIVNSKNHLCRVLIGRDSLPIVCGAPNIRLGILVPVIVAGGKLPNGRIIGREKISGFNSCGMICSQAELNLGSESDVIWELNRETTIGKDFKLGEDLHHYFPQDTVFELEITHNRSDCLSHLGIAREIAAALKRKLILPSAEVVEIPSPAERDLSVEILDPERCPRYCGRVMKKVEIKPSPIWLQSRLIAVGQRPINNIVDVTNYVMLELGHPLHAFDLDVIYNHKIVVKTAQNGQRFITLDEKEHTLTAEDLLICDGEKGVALAGVMGGLNSEITEKTRDILLECAYFSPIGIRRTSKRLKIASDSSYRFERGVDPNAVAMVIDRAARLVRETAGGEVLAGRVDNYAKKIFPTKIKLRPSRVNFILGTRIKKDKIQEYLERLGLEMIFKEGKFTVTVPTHRGDLEQEIDLIEEVARIYGYNRVATGHRSFVSLEVEPLEEEDFDTLIRKKLVEEGLQEVLTYSMRQEGKSGLSGLPAVKIRNPISADFALLRSDLYAPLLDIAAHNLNYGAESVRIFELGHIFRCSENDGVEEKKSLAGLLVGKASKVHWNMSPLDFDFFHLKGTVENFLKGLTLDNYQINSYLIIESIFEYAQEVRLGGDIAGEFGCLKKNISEDYDIKLPVFLFSFDYSTLIKHHRSETKFLPFSRFPVVKRDLSLIFPEMVTAWEIEKTVRDDGGVVLKKIEFFDLYRGKQLPAGKKSVSISLKFQSAERTLTDEEVEGYIRSIITGLEQLGGELRRI